MRISFLGSAGTVTGSKFHITSNDTEILIDCGLFQGLKQLRALNWEELPLQPHNLSAVVITHGHLDHCGYLPLLVKQGFKGPIYCTAPTRELAEIILLDSAQIQMEDAAYANKKGFSKHHPALPLYDIDDVKKTISLLKPVDLNTQTKVGIFEFKLSSVGHILGACSVLLNDNKTSIFFSGDIGRYNDPLMPAPAAPLPSDYMVMESTYGDRHHSTRTSSEELRELVNQAYNNRSVLLIPAFAVGRAQNILYELVQLKNAGLIPVSIPIYFNTPMGEEVWALYKKFSSFQKIEHKDFDTFSSQVHFIKSAEESKALNEKSGPMIIIAASGMLTGGRVLHHLKAFAEDAKNIILLAGFQAAGTRGATLASGQKRVKLHGMYLNVNAKVINSDSFSAHADQDELLKWLSLYTKKPKTVFLAHGEPTASDELRRKIEETLGLIVKVPNLHDAYELNDVAKRAIPYQK